MIAVPGRFNSFVPIVPNGDTARRHVICLLLGLFVGSCLLPGCNRTHEPAKTSTVPAASDRSRLPNRQAKTPATPTREK